MWISDVVINLHIKIPQFHDAAPYCTVHVLHWCSAEVGGLCVQSNHANTLK